MSYHLDQFCVWITRKCWFNRFSPVLLKVNRSSEWRRNLLTSLSYRAELNGFLVSLLVSHLHRYLPTYNSLTIVVGLINHSGRSLPVCSSLLRLVSDSGAQKGQWLEGWLLHAIPRAYNAGSQIIVVYATLSTAVTTGGRRSQSLCVHRLVSLRLCPSAVILINSII